MKILIMGLPGSGKSTLAKPFAELIGGIWINADQVREKYNDWDFSPEGRVRQAQRMKHLADGKPNREIAQILHISIRTVDTHRSNILKKLELKTNAELVKLAIQNGLINV